MLKAWGIFIICCYHMSGTLLVISEKNEIKWITKLSDFCAVHFVYTKDTSCVKEIVVNVWLLV
jgi:hypothetical protein